MGALPEFRGQAEDEPCAHVEEYRKTKQTCHAKLQDIWSDLELDGAAREQQVKDITERALGIWTGAVQHAENHRQSIRTRIDQAAEEMRSIAALLGESEAIEDTNSSIASLLVSPGKTLKQQFDEVMGELETWRRKKAGRLAEHDDLTMRAAAIADALGAAPAPRKRCKNCITKANMEFLKLELERLRSEKVKRERRLEAGLAKLRKVCIEVGADDGEVAASVHPSLRTFAARMHDQYASGASKPASAAADEVALTESVFTALDARLEELAGVRAQREAQLAELRDKLASMWESVEISPTDENRRFFERALESPARLHASTHDKCQEELARLEVVSAKAMRAIIARNAAAARALCVSTGLPAPDLSAVLAGAQAEGSGQVSAALHKLSVVTAALREVVAAREPVMRGAQEVEDAFREVHWLVTHQQDAQFNNRGRDANRVLQRTIKAEERKKRLPKLIARLRQLLEEWGAAHGGGAPFMLGAMPYATHVLDVIEDDFHAMADMKPPRPEPRKRPGTAGGKPPPGPKPAKVPGAALAAIAAAREAPHAAARPATAPPSRADSSRTASARPRHAEEDIASAVSLGSAAPGAPQPQETPRTVSLPACTPGRNPLQDLVDGVVSAPRATPHSAAASRYSAAPPPPPAALQSLQIDDTVNLGSRQPSPAAPPPETFSAIDQSYVTTRAGALSGAAQSHVSGGAVSGKCGAAPHSPAASARSLQSEALSQLSLNAGRGARPRTPDPDAHEPIKAFSPVKDVSPPLKSPERGAEPLMLENVAAATDVM